MMRLVKKKGGPTKGLTTVGAIDNVWARNGGAVHVVLHVRPGVLLRLPLLPYRRMERCCAKAIFIP